MGFLTKFRSRVETFGDEIVAMAFERKKALAILNDLQIKIAFHLFMLAHFPDHAAARGWLKELRAWHGTLRLHNKAKRPRLHNYDRARLERALWSEPLGGNDEQIEIAHQVANKGLPLVTPDPIRLRRMVEKFIDDVLDLRPGHPFDPPSQ